ncbi:MAG TPA: hypothetical protein VN369_04880 [Terriglobales bacterium]|nr:hypothetical protein [Terriglobales bacterium]
MGRLIVVDGPDGSGKQTQTKRLAERLNCRRLEFPTYTKSSALIEMYLAGDFGARPEEVNVYAASTFYAVDRYASYARDWGADYKAGKLLLCDRYATANVIHQMSKLPREKWEDYIGWMEDLEYTRFGLPRPDAVVYLDLPAELSAQLMAGRDERISGDIHERSLLYLANCRRAAQFATERLHWLRVDCAPEGQLLAPDAITEIIIKQIGDFLC